MASPYTAYVALDVLASLLTLAVVGFFFASWRRSDATLHLMLALGFLLVALGFLGVSVSQFELSPTGDRWYALRLAGRTGGAIVLAFAYLSAWRHGSPRPFLVLSAAAAAVAVLMAILYWVAPPFGTLPSPSEALHVAHGVQLVAYSTCTVVSLRGFVHAPRLDRALVPLAFFAWTLTMYTWLLIDLSGAEVLLPFTYLWRFVALGLLVLALVLPVRLPAGGADAPA